jgi:hypothetical protein
MSNCWAHVVHSRAIVAGIVMLAAHTARAAQVPNPWITASADAFNPSYVADNVFDQGSAEFATSGNSVGTPFSEDPNDGTWINFDFNEPVTIDTFINRTRVNAVDVIERSRLVFSSDATFDASDAIVEFDPTGSNGAGIIQRFAPRTAQYVRWEALSTTGGSPNLGSRQMFFLQTPEGQTPLPNPTVYNGTAAFNANYALQNAANGNAGRDGNGNEYASAGAGADTFVDFDFGAASAISGFDFLNREEDIITTYDVLFSDTADFSTVIDTKSFTASDSGNDVNTEVFDAVTARYLRLQATSFARSPNTGISDITFYTPVPEPGSLSLLGMAGLPLLRRRRAQLH